MLAAPAAQAQWTGKAELGILFADGNTESKSANTKLDLTHEGAKWTNNFYFAALYGENAEFANAERYEARYQANWKITDKLSWFFGLRGEAGPLQRFRLPGHGIDRCLVQVHRQSDHQARCLVRCRLSAPATANPDPAGLG